jgi:membrane protein DedA with SNARE-associated domain
MNPSSVMRWLEGMHGPLPYAALFAVAFAEHALLIGTLVPGEVILPLAGVVAATTGALAWLPAALCASVGGFLADQLAYWLARSWMTRRDERAPSRAGGRFARPAAMVRELYRRHGVWMLVLGRFVAGWRRSWPRGRAGPAWPIAASCRPTPSPTSCGGR